MFLKEKRNKLQNALLKFDPELAKNYISIGEPNKI